MTYDLCEACGSLWLDAGELDRMAFQVAGSIEYCSTEEAEGAAGPARPCPRCGGPSLDRVSFIGSDIVLERCPGCEGFWLDGGELDLINRELESIMPVTGKGFSEFVDNLHLPYWHKRVRVRPTGADAAPDMPLLKGAKLECASDCSCPACKGILNRYAIYGMEIEGCPVCGGVWLDAEELRRLKERAQAGTWRTLRWLDDELDAIETANAALSRRTCPKCPGQEMVSTAFGDSTVVVDWCPSCHGTWLDRGEFERIKDFLDARLDEMTPQEARAAVYEEIKEIWNGPEGKIAEILDAKAAISALVNLTIFQHPRLCKLLFGFSRASRALGA